MLRRSLLLVLLAACAPAAPPPAAAPPAQAHDHAAHDHTGAAPEQLGSVAFPVSCSAEAQQRFGRAVAMLHSFWFEEAEKAFSGVAEADPKCAMAHWGRALTLMGNLFAGPPPEANLKAALAAAERAEALAGSASARERGYIAGALALTRDQERLSHAERMQRHEAALRALRETAPDDMEATIFYARAVIGNAPPSDLTFARQKEAAAILQPLFREHPNHPGLAHYLIHGFDSPQLAEYGLEAARAYAEIAPSAPHALHMPSHIFTRLGYWDESIETNRRSANAEPVPDAAVHPLDYMVYAYLQQGRDRAAGEVVERVVQLPDRFYGGVIGYNFVAMPARFALERGRWEEASRLTVPTGAAPFVTAVAHFARAIGAARSGQPALAREEVAALAALENTLEEQKNSYWATIVGAQRLAATAWLARAEGRDEEALRVAGAAAELEETIEKHPVTPGPLLPARELLGDLLLELNRPAEARQAYEKSLEREPNRARSLFGAARAAELAGDLESARTRYAELAQLMAPSDGDRAELRVAREFMARR
ncbi:MAG: hypothetical protein ACR2H9_09170 [Longimicrobiaceae bacterium]